MFKKDLLIVMADLDGTIIPAESDQIGKLALKLDEIAEKNNIEVKFCPVTGRPSNYILSLTDIIGRSSKLKNKDGITGYATGEYGSVIIDCKNDPFERVNLCNPEYEEYLWNIKKDFPKSKYSKYFNMATDGHFITAFSLKKKYKDNFSEEKQKSLYEEFQQTLKRKYGEKMEIWFSGVIEMKPYEVSKDKGAKWIIDKYQKSYNIKGITYCADSLNDKDAISYITKLGIIPGMKVNILLPQNARDSVIKSIDNDWKNKYAKFGIKKNVSISEYKNSDGIVDLLDKHLINSELITKNSLNTRTKDDISIRYHYKGI